MFMRFFDLPVPVTTATTPKVTAVKDQPAATPKPMVVEPTPIRIRPAVIPAKLPEAQPPVAHVTKPEPVRYGRALLTLPTAAKPKLSRKEQEAELARKRADRLSRQPAKGPSERVDTRKGLNPPSRERRQS